MSKMREVKGYMTVEMSFILPLICFAIVLLISFFFYLMDYGIIKGIVYEENLKASDVMKTNGNIENGNYSLAQLNERDIFYLLKPDETKIREDTKNNIETQIKKRIMLGKIKNISVNISNGKIKTTAIVNVQVPVLGSVHFFGIHLFQMKIEKETGIYMEAESVRRWELIEGKKD